MCSQWNDPSAPYSDVFVIVQVSICTSKIFGLFCIHSLNNSVCTKKLQKLWTFAKNHMLFLTCLIYRFIQFKSIKWTYHYNESVWYAADDFESCIINIFIVPLSFLLKLEQEKITLVQENKLPRMYKSHILRRKITSFLWWGESMVIVSTIHSKCH